MSRDLKEKTLTAVKWFVVKNSVPRSKLVAATGLTEAQLSNILTGVTRLPHEKTLRKLAEALRGDVKILLEEYDAASAGGDLNVPALTGPKARASSPAVAPVLQELSSVIDHLLESVVPVELKGRLTPVVSAIRSVLNAEAVALFLLPHDSPNELVLTASESDRLQVDSQLGLHLKIHSATGGGLTGNVVKSWKATKLATVNLRFGELTNNKYVAETYQNHLVGGKGYSTLFVPLKDRHSRLVGLITVANKKGPDGTVGEQYAFTKDDEQRAELLAEKIVGVLELNFCLQLFHRGLTELQRGAEFKQIRSRLLQGVVDVMRADTGELAIWDRKQHNLVFEEIVSYKDGQFGMGNQPAQVNDVVSLEHPARHAWLNPDEKSRRGKGHLLRNSLSIALSCNGRVLGALNLESDAFKEFKERDCDVFNVLGKWAGIILQAAEAEAQMANLMQTVLKQPKNLQSNLENILESMHVIYGASSGAIYAACDQGKNLKCAAYYDDIPIGQVPEEQLKPKDRERSVVMRHFLSPKLVSYYSSNPREERDVPQVELDQFKFEGSLLVIPLEFDSKPVGALVSWSKESAKTGNQNPLNKGHLTRFQGLAALAAWCIATAQPFFEDFDSERQKHVAPKRR